MERSSFTQANLVAALSKQSASVLSYKRPHELIDASRVSAQDAATLIAGSSANTRSTTLTWPARVKVNGERDMITRLAVLNTFLLALNASEPSGMAIPTQFAPRQLCMFVCPCFLRGPQAGPDSHQSQLSSRSREISFTTRRFCAANVGFLSVLIISFAAFLDPLNDDAVANDINRFDNCRSASDSSKSRLEAALMSPANPCSRRAIFRIN